MKTTPRIGRGTTVALAWHNRGTRSRQAEIAAKLFRPISHGHRHLRNFHFLSQSGTQWHPVALFEGVGFPMYVFSNDLGKPIAPKVPLRGAGLPLEGRPTGHFEPGARRQGRR